MLKLRTKTAFNIPKDRGVVQSIVRLTIEKLEIDQNNVIVHGYYYHYDENDNAVILSQVSKNPKQWSEITTIEDNILDPLTSTTNLYNNLYQRLNELTLLTILQETPYNYGTTDTDWEIDI